MAEFDFTPLFCFHISLQPLHHLTSRQRITPLVRALRATLRQAISAFNKRKQSGESNSPFTLTEALYAQQKWITHFISRIILLFHVPCFLCDISNDNMQWIHEQCFIWGKHGTRAEGRKKYLLWLSMTHILFTKLSFLNKIIEFQFSNRYFLWIYKKQHTAVMKMSQVQNSVNKMPEKKE